VNDLFRVKRHLMMIFNEISREFDATRRRPWDEIYLIAKKDQLIADVGCGSGRHAIAAIECGSEVLAIDLSRDMLRIALNKSRVIGKSYLLHPILCDMNFMPLRGEVIDGAACLATIHHIPSKSARIAALNEIFRALKPNGMLVLSVWAKYQPRFFSKIPAMLWKYVTGKVREFGDTYVPWRSRKGTFHRFYHLFSRREAVQTVGEAGFKVIKVYGKSFKSRFFAENHVVIGVKAPTSSNCCL